MISLERIISQALKDAAVLAMLRNALTSSLVVANPYYRQIVQWVSEFYTEHKSIPKSGDYEFWTSTLADPLQSGVQQALGVLLRETKEDWTPDYIAKEVGQVLKAVAARNAVARLETMVPDVKPEVFQEIAEAVKAVEPVTLHGLLGLKDVSRLVFAGSDDEKKITTGSPTLDRAIGGWKQELIFLMADTGMGKTAWLVNFGASAALMGAKVLHFTFELSAENTLKRYFRRVAEADQKQLRNQPTVVVDRVNHWLRMAKGSVHVLYQGAYSTGSDELQALVEQYVSLHGKVDFIILDYLDLMKPPQGFKSEYEALGRLSHLVRNLCPRYETAVMSATQASRVSHKRRHLRLDAIGDSYRKAQAADIILGWTQTDEEMAVNQGRLGLLKVRENPGRGYEVPMFVDLDLMYIADLDHPNTLRILQERHKGTQTTPFIFTDD